MKPEILPSFYYSAIIFMVKIAIMNVRNLVLRSEVLACCSVLNMAKGLILKL